MRNPLYIFLLFSFWLNTYAQENWTLKQCIEYGLENNRNNTIYANQKIADDAKAKEALAAYLPNVSITSTIDNNLRLQQSVIPAGIFGPEERRISLTQKFNSGIVAQIDQVIFDQSLLAGLKARKYNKQQADFNIEQSKESIIYNISTAYFKIFVYNQQLEHLEYNKDTYEKQMEIFRLQVSKGITLQKDFDKVSVDYSNTLTQIRLAQSNKQLAENELKFEMGFPIDNPLSIDVSSKMEVSVPLNDSIKSFLPASKVDYKLTELKIKVLEIEHARIKAEALPKFTAYARYGAVGFGNNLKGAYDELLPYSAVGLKLSIPIFDFYKRNAQSKQANVSRINAEENLKILENRLKVQYENAQTKLLQAQVNIENDKRNVELAESVLKVTDLQFQKGTTNLTDWLNTQNSLKEAQSSYLNSLYSYYQARIDFERVSGTLKIFYNSL